MAGGRWSSTCSSSSTGRARRDLSRHELEVRRRLSATGRGRLRTASAVRILDDGTTTRRPKLGAIGDLELTIRECGDRRRPARARRRQPLQREPGAVRASSRGRRTRRRSASTTSAIWRRSGSYNAIELDDDGPADVLRGEAGAAAQHADRDRALLLPARSRSGSSREYLAEGNNPDQPGRLVQWLYPRTPVYAWRVPGRWYDIGSAETLAEADAAFSQRELGTHSSQSRHPRVTLSSLRLAAGGECGVT